MPKEVLSDQGCDCGCNSGGGVPPQPSLNPADQIVVRSKPGITTGNVINAFIENGKKIFELDDLNLVKPVVAFSNDYPVIEVGQTIALVTFSGNITQGTYPISSRQISPDPGGLDLTAPFNFTKANVKRTTPGTAHLHTVTATDNQGNSTAVNSGVAAKNAIYQGFNGSPTLTQAQIKALANKHLIDSVLSQYGGSRNYVVPGVIPLYIYFAAPVGTPIIGSATMNGFAVPLIDVGPVTVDNIHDGSLNFPYWVKRTANKFDPGTYSIFLS